MCDQVWYPGRFPRSFQVCRRRAKGSHGVRGREGRHVPCTPSHPHPRTTVIATGRVWRWRVTRRRRLRSNFTRPTSPGNRGWDGGVGGGGGGCRAGPSSSSSSSALCATARQMGGPASSVAAAPSEPSFICQLITPCSVHLRIVSPHTDTCAPAFWQPRAGTVPAASPERQRAGPHGQRKAGWQVGGETVGVRSHKSSSEAFLFNTLFPFELSVKPLIN